jgi:hypothetical protein
VQVDTSIENPSPIGVYTGDTGFSISYLDVELFKANVSHFNLTAGANNVTMNGIMKKMDQSAGYAVGSFVASYLNGTTITTKAKAISSIVDGKEIQWIEKALANVTIESKLHTEPFQTLSNMDLGNITFDFVNGSAFAPLLTAGYLCSPSPVENTYENR